jgi:RHS repeat-associated protein
VIVVSSGVVSVGGAGADGLGGVTAGGVEARVTESVASTAVTPTLGLALSADRASAVPGELVTYSTTATNTGGSLAVTGSLKVKDAGVVAGVVASWFDYVEYYSKAQAKWIRLGSVAGVKAGYTPVTAAPVSSGLVFSATKQTAAGVVYPTSGDAFLGTTIASLSEASWTFSGRIDLTATQLAAVMNSSDVSGIRNVAHFELQGQTGTSVDGQSKQVGFTKQLALQSPDLRQVAVTLKAPQGPDVRIDSQTVAGLARITPGASVVTHPTFAPSVLGAKGAGESDSDYLARLHAADGTALHATATGSATVNGTASEDPAGPATTDLILDTVTSLLDSTALQALLDSLYSREATAIAGPERQVAQAAIPAVDVTRRVPIVRLSKSGPASSGTAQSLSYPLSLANEGSAPAMIGSLTDRVGDGQAAAVAGAPSSVAAGATAGATAHYDVADDAQAATLADSAAVGWNDASGNTYGPVSAAFSTQIKPGITVNPTPTSTSLTPKLSLVVTADQASAPAGTTVNHQVKVSNDGGKLALGTTLAATSTADALVSVAAWSELIEYHLVAENRWVTLASASGKRSDYQPRVPLPQSGGLTIVATPQTAAGVDYPQGGDRVVGTDLGAGAEASWQTTETTDLSLAQEQLLLDPARVDTVRSVRRLELVDATGAYVAGQTARRTLTADVRTQSADARAVSLTATAPGASAQLFDSTTTPALSRLAAGDQVTVSVSSVLPAPAAKGASESDLDYLNRLDQAATTPLSATATATATATGSASRDSNGTPTAGADRQLAAGPGSSTVHVQIPVVSIANVGPASAGPGSHLTFRYTLANTGNAAATIDSFTHHVGSDQPATISGAPSTLAAGASTPAGSVGYDVAGDQPDGDLTDAATVTWKDAANHSYGPVNENAVVAIAHTTPLVAPKLDTSAANPFIDQVSFLYQGADAIQSGVSSGAISATRVAAIRGTVTARDGGPLPGVTLSVPGHPEYGSSTSRNDGSIYLVVNGGGPVRVRYEHSGYLTAERTVDVPLQDYAFAPDVAMVQPDSAANGVDLGLASPVQVARGTAQSDSSGTRRATLIFQPGTTATITHADGSSTPTTHLTVRATEYTVGASGPKSMPATLPTTSAYTYAADYGADETVAGDRIDFSIPAVAYEENFLGFSVGSSVPAGYYDQKAGSWKGAPDGRVIRILSTSGGIATLDVAGSGQAATAATLAGLGITDAERTQLATLYTANQTLWRVPTPHFTPWDHNYPARGPAGSTGPSSGGSAGSCGGGSANGDGCGKTDNPCQSGGSVIECDNQTLREDLNPTGVGAGLHYASDRVPGRVADNTLSLPVSGSSVPAPLKRIDIAVSVAGRQIHDTRPAAANQTYSYTWDGLDAYGRRLQGSQPATVTIGYAYDAVYTNPAAATTSFAAPGVTATTIPSRDEVVLSSSYRYRIGAWDARAAGLGGWTLDGHNSYDPAAGVLYFGDGTRRSAAASAPVIKPFAGTGSSGSSGDGGQAANANIGNVGGMAVGPDGSVYYAESNFHRIRKIAPDGIITTVAGTGTGGFSGDGGPATAAKLSTPNDVSVGPDGSVYISDGNNARVRKVDPAGTITTLGIYALPAAVTALADGSVLVVDRQTGRVSRIAPDGSASFVAGGGGSTSEGALATQSYIYDPTDVEAAPDGGFYLVMHTNPTVSKIKRVMPDGKIYTVAGTSVGFSGDGGPATAAQLTPDRISLARDGSLFVADPGNYRIRRIAADGTISTYAGNGAYSNSTGDGGAASDATIGSSTAIAVAPDGTVYTGTSFARIRSISQAFPTFTAGNLTIPSQDGSEVYEFDPNGRHLRTVDTTTNQTVATFGYDSAGRLASITDIDGDKTTISHDSAGHPTKITGPYGDTTTLTSTAAGYLHTITDPAGNTHTAGYDANGLLTSWQDARGNTSNLTYDSQGRLTADNDRAGNAKTLARTLTANGHRVDVTTPEGHVSGHTLERLPNGDVRRTTTDPAGLVGTQTTKPNGTGVTATPDGTSATTVQSPDPRFGLMAPFTSQTTFSTPAARQLTTTSTRQVTLSNPQDPLSLTALTQSSTTNAKTATRTYDATTRRWTMTSPASRTTTTDTDTKGRPTTTQLPGLAAVATGYDSHGRPTTLTQGARQTAYSYDAHGRVARVDAPEGQSTSYSYDLAGRLTSQTLPDGRTLGFTYDADGNVTAVTPPGRTAHGFAFSAVGLLSDDTAQDTGAGAPVTHYGYNRDHQLTAINRPDSTTVTLSYDTAGRLSKITRPAGDTTYAYDAQTGHVTSETAPGNERIAYSRDGSLVTQTAVSGTVGATIGHSFDSDLRLSQITVNGSDPIAYGYDNDNLLTSAGALAITRNSTSGQISTTTLGAVTTSQTLNTFGELDTTQASASGSGLYSAGYTRDQLGRVTSVSETTAGQSTAHGYVYDAGGRLSDIITNGTASAHYDYDQNSNRVRKTTPGGATTAAYDAQDRLTRWGSHTYTYTTAGDLRTDNTSAGTTTYGYDPQGALTAVDLPDGHHLTYTMDAAGRRIARARDGQITQRWLYDAGAAAPTAQVDASGQVVARYIYATRPNVPDYILQGGHTYRIVSDQLGSVHLVVDTANGAIAQRIDYDENGAITNNTAPGFQPFGYAGGLTDPDHQLVRFGARDYDPTTARWTTSDPASYAGADTNLYGYANGDPINGIDPSGLDSFNPLDWGVTQTFADFASGGFDQLTFGATKAIRQAIGSDGVNYCSAAYGAGGTTGIIASFAIPGGGEIRGLEVGAELAGAAGAAKGAVTAVRTAPRSLAEKLTLDEAEAGAGRRIMQGKINDPRYPEEVWAKMQHVHEHPDGTQTVIHYWQNLQTGAREGFKFK